MKYFLLNMMLSALKLVEEGLKSNVKIRFLNTVVIIVSNNLVTFRKKNIFFL